MLKILGGGKKSRKHYGSRRLKGGSSLANAAPYPDGANVSSLPSNYIKSPTYSTTQVGGGDLYPNNSVGFNPSYPGALKDIAAFGGSYYPASFSNTGGMTDPARGGNNFVGGGRKKRSARKYKGGRKRSGHKRSGRKRTMKKWWQMGCSKKTGGYGRSMGVSRAGGTRKHKKQRGGLLSTIL